MSFARRIYYLIYINPNQPKMERKPKLTYKRFIRLTPEGQSELIESSIKESEQPNEPKECVESLLRTLTELDVKVCACRRCVEVFFPSTFTLCVLNPPYDLTADFLVFLVRRTLSVLNLQKIAGGCTAVCSFGSTEPTELATPNTKTPCSFCKQRRPLHSTPL